ncbi:allophanate hydrolase subunit 2 family protein, partial [Microbispora rosea]
MSGATADEPRRALVVLAPGPLTTVQDLGRRRHSHLGVGRSGAADRG